MSLTERARTGLKDMPSNAAWVLSRALQPVESAAAGARDQRRRVGAAVVDAAPVGGDSVEIRMERARDAAERASEAEDQALEAAQVSKELSEHARQVSERGRARKQEVDRETNRELKQRMAEAQRAADELVAREREAAEAEAEEQRQEVYAEVDEEIEEAQGDAEAARQRAEELVEEATEKLAEARRLADESAEAARAAAEDAQRRAQQLASEAEQQAGDAEARIATAEQIRDESKATAKQTVRKVDSGRANGGLQSYNKPKLLELAASIGIEGRTNMSKGELVNAITKASRTKR
jgi:colicin import membrane protein